MYDLVQCCSCRLLLGKTSLDILEEDTGVMSEPHTVLATLLKLGITLDFSYAWHYQKKGP